MLRKYLARLLSLVLVLNLVLCAPLSVRAAEGTEEGDMPSNTPIISDEDKDALSMSQDDTLVVTEDEVSVSTNVDIGKNDPVADQTVIVETPLAGTEIDATGKENVHEESYEGNNGETIPFTEEDSLDLKVEITDVQKENEQVTDIEYDISLDAQMAITEHPAAEEGSNPPAEKTEYYSQPKMDQWLNGGAPEDERSEFKVNMSINGMNSEEVTRVEHKYKQTEGEEEKVEYYYNDKTKTNTEADNGKKFFTVVQDTVENVTTSFVSLVTNFLGKFHITTKAFEGSANKNGEKEVYSDLATAVNSAGEGSTVNMLRDYSTDDLAIIQSSENVTVDLGGNTYTREDGTAVFVDGSNETLTIQNGKVIAKQGNGVAVIGGENTVKILNSEIDSNIALYVYGDRNRVNVSDTTMTATDSGNWDFGKNNAYTIKDSKIVFGGRFGLYHNGSDGGASYTVENTTIDPSESGAVGIYISGSSTTANKKDEGLNKLILVDSEVAGYKSAVEVKFTDVTIDNSILKGLGNPPEHVDNSSGTTTTGAALAVTDNSDGKTGGTILINSGKFYGHKDIDNIYQTVKETTGDDKATITILGGRYVNTSGLYPFIPEGYAAISHNDGSEYPYEVVAKSFVPTRPGYTFLGYKDDKGNDITLKDAIANKAIAYAQWEKVVEVVEASVQTPTTEAPVKAPTTEAPKDTSGIIVEADAKGNNVDVSIQGSTAVVTVATPAGEAAAVSEVTIPSVAELQEQGVKSLKVQVEKGVTLELGVAKNDDIVAESIKITREEDKLVITDSNKSEIVIHVEELKAVATKPVSIKLDSGVLTVNLGNGAYKLNVKDALAISKSLTMKLENGVLKLYDSKGNLVQEVKI